MLRVKELHAFSGSEQAGLASGDPWSAAAPDILRRIAAGTTSNLAARLQQMGYSVRLGELLPPARGLARQKLAVREN